MKGTNWLDCFYSNVEEVEGCSPERHNCYCKETRGMLSQAMMVFINILHLYTVLINNQLL